MARIVEQLGLQNNDCVMVIAAHPDDETIGVGGTLHMLAAHGGLRLHVVFVTDGVSSRTVHDIPAREKMAHGALYELVQRDIDEPTLFSHGVASRNTLTCNFMRAGDQALNTASVAWLANSLAQSIALHRPTVVFTHFGEDLNADHRFVSEATRIATQDSRVPLRWLLAYPVWSSTEHARLPFVPNFFVALSNQALEAKQRAIGQYDETEDRGRLSPRSARCLQGRAVIDGSCIRTNFAEGFQLIRAVL